jgi:hypothetical protein
MDISFHEAALKRDASTFAKIEYRSEMVIGKDASLPLAAIKKA